MQGAGSAGTIPTGVVTFLFTDVEGSTRLWADEGDAMAASLRVHDAVLRDVIERHDGYVFATGGDAFCAAFQSATAGLAAATAAQDGLRSAAWPGPGLRVRMGMHLGEAEERNGDYFGPTVNTCARVAGAGHGGQVLLTDAVVAAVDQPARDLGEHRLRDLGRPTRLYQHSEGEFPPLRSLDTVRATLPATRNALIGRTAELEEVQRILTEHRLVALTGVGGCGKTRLAIELGWKEAMRSDHSVFFCDLTTVQDDDQVDEAVMVALGMTARPGVDVRTQVVDFVGDRSDWLIIDNCEHVLDGAADLVEAVLNGCADARVLITSREALGVEGERVWRIPSMDVGANSSASRLFVERAVAASSTFDVGAHAEVIADICQQLDGIPLAIELAAARTTSLGLVELRERLDDRFRLLAGGRRRQQRQQTLSEVVDWSHDLLDDDEQLVFRRLAVFSGGFDVDDVGSVVGIDALDALELVDALVAKSLVDTTIEESGRVRHRLLETLRLYALQQLRNADELVSARDAHLAHFSRTAADAPETVLGDVEAMRDVSVRVTRNSENFLAAMLWAEETGRRSEMTLLAALLMSRLGQQSVEGALPWLDISSVSDPGHLGAVAYAVVQAHQGRRDIETMIAKSAQLRSIPGMPEPVQQWLTLLSEVPDRRVDPANALERLDEIERLALVEGGYEFMIKVSVDYQRVAVGLALDDVESAADAAERMVSWVSGGQVLFYGAVAMALAGRYEQVAALEVDQVEGVMDPARWAEDLVDVVAALVAENATEAARRLIDLEDDDFLRGQPLGYGDVIALWGWIALVDGDLPRARRLLRIGSFTGGVEDAMCQLLARAEEWPRDEFAQYREQWAAHRWSPEFASLQADWPLICAEETEYWHTRAAPSPP